MHVQSPLTTSTAPLTSAEFQAMNAWWRAANDRSVGPLCLPDNSILQVPLTRAHVKPRLLGHFGTAPRLNFICTHLNRVIKAWNLSVLFVAGPGHGAPGVVASSYLEGTSSDIRQPGLDMPEVLNSRWLSDFPGKA